MFMSASKAAQPAPAPEPVPGLKQLRTELGRVNDRLADARAPEAAAAVGRFREELALLGITEEEVQRALGLRMRIMSAMLETATCSCPRTDTTSRTTMVAK